MSTEVKVQYLTWNDLTYLQERMSKLEKKIKLLTGLLIDKKIIGEEMGKAVSESIENKELIKWFMAQKESD